MNKLMYLKQLILNQYRLLGLITLVFSISACEIIPQSISQNNTRIPTYGDYYLWLKTLDNDELLQEIEQQNKNKTINNPDANIYVMLLHSLPKSPIYNPYTAKSMLNKLELQYVESRYNPTNLALITLLRDLLNEQLLTREKQNSIAVQLQNSQKMLSTLQEKSGLRQKELLVKNSENIELKHEIEKLKEQINQLHRIEKNINEHGK